MRHFSVLIILFLLFALLITGAWYQQKGHYLVEVCGQSGCVSGNTYQNSGGCVLVDQKEVFCGTFSIKSLAK